MYEVVGILENTIKQDKEKNSIHDSMENTFTF